MDPSLTYKMYLSILNETALTYLSVGYKSSSPFLPFHCRYLCEMLTVDLELYTKYDEVEARNFRNFPCERNFPNFSVCGNSVTRSAKENIGEEREKSV